MASYKVYVGNVLVATIPAGTTTWTSGAYPDGTYSVAITAVDTSGNESAPNSAKSVTVTRGGGTRVDTTPPSVPSAPSGSLGNDGKAYISWTPSPESDTNHYNIYDKGVLIGTVDSSKNTFETGVLTEGSHAITITAVDDSGNESSASNPIVIVAPDTTPPAVPNDFTVVGGTGSITIGKIGNWDPDVNAYLVYDSGVLVGAITGSNQLPKVFSLPSGSHVITVVAQDSAGNKSAPSTPITVTVASSNNGSSNNNGNTGIPSTNPPTDAVTPGSKDKATLSPSEVKDLKDKGEPFTVGEGNNTVVVNPVDLPDSGNTTITVLPVEKDQIGKTPTPVIKVTNDVLGDNISLPNSHVTVPNPFDDVQYYAEVSPGVWDYVKPRKDANGNWYIPIAASVIGVKSEGVSFSDTQGHWANGSIEKLANMHIINGYEDGSFKPNQTVTRAEFTSMLVNAVLYEHSKQEGLSFEDVSVTAWYYNAIAEGKSNSMVKGMSETSFSPTSLVSKQEAIAMSVRWIEKLHGSTNGNLDSLLEKYTDSSSISGWALNEFTKGLHYGIVSGDTSGDLSPKKQMTRAEAATVILNLISKY